MMIETPSGSLETGPDMRVGSTEPLFVLAQKHCVMNVMVSSGVGG